MSVIVTRQLLQASHAELDIQEARSALEALRSDKDWVRRYFAGDEVALNEQAYWVHVLANGSAPFMCPMPAQMSAAELRRDAELKHDSAIPTDVLAAIAEQDKAERASKGAAR